ncbi:MAG: NADH-quinone oxidoreductase subunit NuoG [Rickettsia endosymbiont of Ixodes persulcatus]|nr:NADH-quinone oxidoreductase subunit NuoG [Rickettsia endosymbiont of Ixodes persulcatus]MCZ6903391.1 NADH-quinone oxidoreductase subunit NuoG [Rickettsia endosymbiont of Ixodes persulcatus]MCZ6908774.1 NADH-quinone oxidoreductase subunit NuoG [Rickettsia endosymbiont of Ixodes persulcatus]MCZ6909853.1 NADH-quinone oxidoreductase subunit NuoG [Rickettsia endosymbiont of Ixodes persulcatus]MCZ6913172.1 NADH-quinone oxidoreductase subunit NuoG [Rickettsia endosymbiont of Ixodes persulcatus]
MIKLIIDGSEIEVSEGSTVYQACTQAGKEIPHFCYHERLKIAGNCRMCLVEMEKSLKPIASCAMPVSSGMVIHTDTPMVKKAREGVMEFLLINHPLDCPICDQGGECDLQDQAFRYGKGTSRFHENKRSIKDKYMGPLIKTAMTRCIQCTRCIRFVNDIAGIEEMGAIHRGEHMEVTSYLEQALDSEISGNMIDICPVGALNSKPYAFKARKWELRHTNSIGVHDAEGSNIRIDSRGDEVMRILPRVNEEINEEWLSDKNRFSYDGLKYQRLDLPYIRKNGKLVEASWSEALNTIADKIKSINPKQIAAFAGCFAPVEAMFMLKMLLQKLGSNNYSVNQFNYKIDTSERGNYLFNTTIAGVEKADLCLLIGANPRQIAPILNSRIGQRVRAGSLKVARIGKGHNQTYEIQDLGSDIKIIEELAIGTHEFTKALKAAKYPIIIVGDGVYARDDGYAILSLIHKIVAEYNIMRDDWKGFNILHNHAYIVGGLDIGFNSSVDELKETKLAYLLGSDEAPFNKLKSAFIVYQGHHGDAGATNADVILPAAAYTEQSGIYVNLEGRPQIAEKAVSPVGNAKEDIAIIKELAGHLKIGIGMDNLQAVRIKLAEEYKVFASIGKIIENKFTKFSSKDQLLKEPITAEPINYYMTDIISKNSVTMAKCVEAKQSRENIVS